MSLIQAPQSREQVIRYTPMDEEYNERDIVAELLRDIYTMPCRIMIQGRNLRQAPETMPNPVYTIHELKDILAKIQAAFGVSTSDLAEMLAIQRQTVYAWNREENTPKDHNITRLQELDRKADEWNRLSTYPAKLAIKHKLHDGKSLFDLLTAEYLEHNKISQIMANVADQVKDYYNRLNKRTKQTSESPNRPRVSEYDILALESVELPEEE